MADRGLCSRREADVLIANGWVLVNGQVVSQLGSKVGEDVKIELHPEARRSLQAKVTILLNKPIGYVSGQPEEGYRAAVELVTAHNQDREDQRRSPFCPEHRRDLAPAGRLDIDSQGLLVLTQDGKLARQLIHQDSEIKKEYLVRVEGSLSAEGLKLLRHGLTLDGVKLKPAEIDWINEDQLRFMLQEGRKRQIRRMCDAVGLKVRGLKRVAIGQIKLGPLKEGQWRFLKPDEHF